MLFEVLVPNERSNGTTEVELAVPDGVIPFAYQDSPGWRRSLTMNRNQSIRSIVWRGRLATDGFARFAFLASTPPREGTRSPEGGAETENNSHKVRWSRAAGHGEGPAAVTTVSEDAPRQNAGGEGEGGGGEEAPQAPSTSPEEPSESEAGVDGSDTTARVLAGAALAAALASLALALMRRRPVR